MKKIKTLNKLLSSLTLLSPLASIGFNNQYQNTQKVITENNNNSLNNYIASQTNAQREMGDITVNVEGTTITGYVSGTGDLVVDSDITEIAATSFQSNENISSLDLSQATSLTSIGNNAFEYCSNLTGDLIIPSNVTSIGDFAFAYTSISSLDLSQATNLTTIGNSAFFYCENLTGDLVIPSKVTTIGQEPFSNTNMTSIKIDPLNKNFSFATNLGSNAKVLITGTDGIWKDDSISAGSLAFGDISIPKNITKITDSAFKSAHISSLDLSNATSLTIIRNSAFQECSNLTGNLVIPSSVTSIDDFAFRYTSISSLDLSQATSLTSIWNHAFFNCTNLTGDLVIPSKISIIGEKAFGNTTFDNLFFTSETPPTPFHTGWQPTVTGKVYVPSETAKEAYLGAPNFGFNADQVEIGLPPEPTPTPEPSKSNTGLILGLLFGLGIPIILAAGFGIWYLTKKKKTTVKI